MVRTQINGLHIDILLSPFVLRRPRWDPDQPFILATPCFNEIRWRAHGPSHWEPLQSLVNGPALISVTTETMLFAIT